MTISLQEAYKTLELIRAASPDDVKRTYRKLALQFHPDKNPDPTATAMFQQLSAAYKRIDNDSKRGLAADSDELFDLDVSDDDDDFDVGDDFGMPSIEELLFMFDMLLGSQNRPSVRKRSGSRGPLKVRVNVRRKRDTRQKPFKHPAFPPHVDQELMNMFAHGMVLDDMNAELSNLEKEFASTIWSNERKKKTAIPNAAFEAGGGLSKRVKVAVHTAQQDSDAKMCAVKTPSISAPTVGSKVCIHGRHRGVVKFAGQVHYAKGEFIGVALASPTGKNDGLIKGVRYFECSPSHGLMVRPNDVTLAA